MMKSAICWVALVRHNWPSSKEAPPLFRVVIPSSVLVIYWAFISKNDFIDYPFENITASRYSDGSTACWYGSETLEKTIYETRYHFIQEIFNSRDVFATQKKIKIDRRVASVNLVVFNQNIL